MTHAAGSSGINSVTGMGALTAAVSLSKARLEGTKLAVVGVSSSLMPPASDGASLVALTQQQESMRDYLDKMSKGIGHLDQLGRAITNHVAVTVEEDQVASRQFDST